MLDAFAHYAGDADAVVLACFGDPGIKAPLEIAGVPVNGLVWQKPPSPTHCGVRTVTLYERLAAMMTCVSSNRQTATGSPVADQPANSRSNRVRHANHPSVRTARGSDWTIKYKGFGRGHQSDGLYDAEFMLSLRGRLYIRQDCP
jgi:hypothetical protein